MQIHYSYVQNLSPMDFIMHGFTSFADQLLPNKWNVFPLDFTEVLKRLEGGLPEEATVKEPLNKQIHRMCLLRVKLMHFVNSLHNYIMTRVR